MLIKICGISNGIDAMQAIACGATAIGFVMGGKVLPVEVEPHAQTVREIIKTFPKNVDSYVVTHLTEIEDILALTEYVNATGIQVSEDIGVEKLRQLRSRTKKKIIKTVVVDGKKSIASLQGYEPFCDFILLDTRFQGYVGGTGITNNWDLCKKLIDLSKRPVFIAGGLTPENVAEAMRKTQPHGVDVSTGVSTYSAAYLKKDRKDEQKMRAFIGAAKSFTP
ncbi:MAG: phosphoribosylanthranilate isomerase [archaeon]